MWSSLLLLIYDHIFFGDNILTNAIRCFLRWSNSTHKRKSSNLSSSFCSGLQWNWNKWWCLSAAKKRALGSILKRNKEAKLPKTPHDRVKAEIDTYLSLPVIDSESDPLDWWKSQHNSYPSLSKVAKKVSLYMCKQCSIRMIVQYLWKCCDS